MTGLKKKIGKILLSKSNYEIYIKLITQMEDKVLLNQTDLHSHQEEIIFLKKNISEAMQIMDLENYLQGIF